MHILSPKPMIVYLHGLNSSSRSAKAALIRERLAPVPVAAPDYPAHRPDRAVAVLCDVFATLEGGPPVVVGSSMGGFYGQYLARRFAFRHLYLINPALRPWELLGDYLGATMTTANGESYRVGESLIRETRRFAVEDPCDGVPTTVFLDRGDEVIDYRIAESIYRGCGRVTLFAGGDHAFQHMDRVIEELRPEMAP
jgi:predicted esterase YcpF (UPF0227 family)